MDFIDALKKVQNEKFDIIYLDPPYKTSFVKESLAPILKYDCLKEDSLIIIETDEDERVIEEIKDFEIEIIDKRKYGRADIIFLQKKNIVEL